MKSLPQYFFGKNTTNEVFIKTRKVTGNEANNSHYNFYRNCYVSARILEHPWYLPIADKTRTAPNHLNILICCRPRIKSNGSDIRSDYLQIFHST